MIPTCGTCNSTENAVALALRTTAKVTDDQVSELRRGAASKLVPIVQAAIGVVVAATVVAVALFILRRRARQTGQGVEWTPMS